MKDKVRDAIKTLSLLIGTPCPYCGGKWGAHELVMVSGAKGATLFGKMLEKEGLLEEEVAVMPCAAVPIEEAIKDLKSVLDNQQLPFSCPICGRYGCMSDHGY